MDRVSSESEVAQTRSYTLPHTEYLLSGEIIGELNCLTKERMQYSATCKTVVEVGTAPRSYCCISFNVCYQTEYFST